MKSKVTVGAETDVEKQPSASPEELPAEELQSHEGRPACFRSTTHEILFVLTTTMGVAMSSFLMGTMTVVLTTMGSDLKMSTAEITWVNAASSLTSGSFLFFFGRIADLFGRKTLFVGSLGIFAVLALGTGFSQNAITVDVLNGMMGLASAASVPPAQGILGVIYEKPSKRKNQAFACFSAGNPLGFVLGMIFSGIAAQIFNWRASLYLLAIIFAAFTVIALLVVPSDHADKEPLSMDALKKFDLVGTVLTIAGIGLFSCALSLGGDATDGWRTPYVIVLLVLGVLLMIGFVLWENWFEYPLVPMSIWRDRNFSLLISILLFGFLGFSIQTLWASLYLQEVNHHEPLQVAVHLLPMAINGIIVNVVAGFTMHIVSNKLLMSIGAFAYVVSFILMAVQRSHDTYWAFMFPALTLVVVGADFEFCVVNMYVLSSLPPSQQSIAGSIMQTVSKLCVAIGYGISTAVFKAVEASPSKSGFYANDAAEPYAAAFWLTAGFGFVGLCLVPFLTIHTQGHTASENEALAPSRDSDAQSEPRPDGQDGEKEKSFEEAEGIHRKQ